MFLFKYGFCTRSSRLCSARTIGVASVLNRDNVNPVGSRVDAIDHPEIAAARTVQPRHFEPQRLSDALRVLGQRSVDELDDCVTDLGRDLAQMSLCRGRPRDFVGHASARDERPGLIPGEDGCIVSLYLGQAVADLGQQFRTSHDLERLFERFKVLDAEYDGRSPAVFGDDDAGVLTFDLVNDF